MASIPRSYFFYDQSVGLMFASGGKWPSRELPVRTLQCAGLSTGRWMLHNSRRRHLGGMWVMRGGGSEDEGGEGLEQSASVAVVVPRHESQADKMGQWIPTWRNCDPVIQCAVVCRLFSTIYNLILSEVLYSYPLQFYTLHIHKTVIYTQIILFWMVCSAAEIVAW